ncbi:hypothetical protein BDR03DRAFT_1063897 [Suillus americanus]|nr:hypothetical protein BDR03DRAFT_1063897 [Suillus americanus]
MQWLMRGEYSIIPGLQTEMPDSRPNTGGVTWITRGFPRYTKPVLVGRGNSLPISNSARALAKGVIQTPDDGKRQTQSSLTIHFQVVMYRNVTLTLLGRKVMVALGAKGNDFVKTLVRHRNDVPNEVSMEQKQSVKVSLSTENFRAYVGMFEQEVDDFMRSDQEFIIWQTNLNNK